MDRATKNKILIFIIVPLFIIILLIILTIIPIGLTKESIFVGPIVRQDLALVQVEIGVFRVENDHILGRQIELPRYEVCAMKGLSPSGTIDAGNTFFSENDRALFSDARTLTIGPFSEREVKVFLTTSSTLRNNILNEEYDTLFIIDENIEGNVDCKFLSGSTLERGSIVPIV